MIDIDKSSVASPILDWLSFAVPFYGDKAPRTLPVGSVEQVLKDRCGEEFVAKVLHDQNWQNRRGRRPYSDGYANDEIGVYVWGGGHMNFLIEFTGKGCQKLREFGLQSVVLLGLYNFATRLDVAIDIETAIRPINFATDRRIGRIKSFGTQKSESGETCYVGSKSSEQYCRVYRYEPPHPRSQYLRIETVSRKEYAKIAAEKTLSQGVSAVAQMTMNRYNFNQAPNVSDVDETLPAPYRDRSLSKTETWLIKQAMPALRRLAKEQEIDNVQDWLFEHLFESDLEAYSEDVSDSDAIYHTGIRG